MKRSLKSSVAGILTLALIFTAAIPAFAATANQKSSNSQEGNTRHILVQKVTPYISAKSDNTLYIKTDAKNIGISAKDYKSVQKELSTTNQMIKKGYLTADENGTLTITPEYVAEVEHNLPAGSTVVANNSTLTIVQGSQLRASDSGVTQLVYTWYGCDIYLSNNVSNKVVGYGGAAAALAGYISAKLPIAEEISLPLALGLGIWAGLITANNQGSGVVIECQDIINPSGLAIPTPFYIYGQ